MSGASAPARRRRIGRAGFAAHKPGRSPRPEGRASPERRLAAPAPCCLACGGPAPVPVASASLFFGRARKSRPGDSPGCPPGRHVAGLPAAGRPAIDAASAGSVEAARGRFPSSSGAPPATAGLLSLCGSGPLPAHQALLAALQPPRRSAKGWNRPRLRGILLEGMLRTSAASPNARKGAKRLRRDGIDEVRRAGFRAPVKRSENQNCQSAVCLRCLIKGSR